MWQFAEAVRGLADGCRSLGIPVTGGNVSLYNQTGDLAILPTPVVGVLGVMDDVSRRVPSGFTGAGHRVLLLGTTADELDGSAWADVVHGHLGGRPPAVALEAETALAEVLVAAANSGLLETAHDLSDGGLAQALAECCLRAGVGADVQLAEGADPFVQLFSESAARAVVAVRPGSETGFAELCRQHGVPATELGTTGGAGSAAELVVDGLFTVPVSDLRDAWTPVLPSTLAG